MNVLVNALSVTNPSGAQVLLGHLSQVQNALEGRMQLILLVRSEHNETLGSLKSKVKWIETPDCTRHWLMRSLWERFRLPRLIQGEQVDLYLSPSGYAAIHLAISQLILCQNPWAFVPSARRRRDAPKAWLQRRAYARTMQKADAMVFNSEFMRQAYRKNAGATERQGMIAYQAPDPRTLKRARVRPLKERVRGQLLCVSVMGPHKNVETILYALHRLRSDHGLSDARLKILGSWPNRSYQQKIVRLIKTLELSSYVKILGYVGREQLEQFYEESQAFILLSRCESFGIPAVEAQAFGTPVVSSKVCAIPEICGEGGIYADPDDAATVADMLNRLLTDSSFWQHYSNRAQQNAKRFVWERISMPLIDYLASRCVSNQPQMDSGSI